MVGDIGSFADCEQRITDLTKWGVIYQTLRTGTHLDIDQNHLEYLRPFFFTYATLLMDIIDKSSRVENGEIIIEHKSRMNDALKKVVVYDVCRFLGGLPEKEITRFIPTIPKKLEKESEHYYLDYAATFERLVTTTQEGYKQPKINVLKRSVVNIDLYKRTKLKVLRFFVLMENIGKKEILSFERDLIDCQVEHIMPQTLSAEWDYISEPIHDKYLHTLGNLSITFYNQGLSNKSFLEKKKILTDRSRITLNKLLLQYDEFNEAAICDRSYKLLEIFLKAYDLYNESEFNQTEAIISEKIQTLHEDILIRGFSDLYEAIRRIKGYEVESDQAIGLKKTLAGKTKDEIKNYRSNPQINAVIAQVVSEKAIARAEKLQTGICPSDQIFDL